MCSKSFDWLKIVPRWHKIDIMTSERSPMASVANAPWLYDVDAGDEGYEDEKEALVVVDNDDFEDPDASEMSIRCSGVVSSGLQCTRTALIDPTTNANDELYCYRHQYQRSLRSHRGRSSGLCCRSSRARDTRRWFWLRVVALSALFVTAVALGGVGVAYRSALLCAASVVGLVFSMCGACALMYAAIVRSLPPPSNIDKVVEMAVALSDSTTRPAESA